MTNPAIERKKGKCKKQYNSGRVNNQNEQESAYNVLLTYNKVVGYINKKLLMKMWITGSSRRF